MRKQLGGDCYSLDKSKRWWQAPEKDRVDAFEIYFGEKVDEE